jgi:3-deoxy-D-manno-octulosonic-acid transferase
VEPLLAWANRHGLQVATLSEAEGARTDETGTNGTGNADVVVIDRVGVLGDLYAHANVAFVGGGFHRAGLHSAIEPAAFGAPVLFGPGHGMSREAGLLLAAGGARCVRDTAECASVLLDFLKNAEPRRVAGEAAREIVARERGATERSVALLAETLLSAIKG